MSKLFIKSKPPEEKTEEQTQHNYDVVAALVGTFRGGQRLTIPNRKVTKLAFLLSKYGSPTGNLAFAIRRTSDDSLICSNLWGQCEDLPTTPEWIEQAFDNPQIINEEVRIFFEYTCLVGGNQVSFRCQNTDVKPDETESHYRDATWYQMEWDTAYRYKYYEV
ncbi:hypothetical protein ES703_61858 [subsurface metagenome]